MSEQQQMTTANETENVTAVNNSSTDSGVGGSGSSSGEQNSSGCECNTASRPVGGEVINECSDLKQKEDATAVQQPNTFGTYSPAHTANANANHSMLSNVVGYARSRLFRHANDGLVPTASQNGQKESPYGLCLHPEQSQSARGTPTKRSGWEQQAQKSCPVGRRQFGQQQTNGQLAGLEAQIRDRDRDALSVGSRESVSGAETSLNQSLCSSRASWQNGVGIRPTANGNNKATEHWQLFAVTLQKATQGGFGIAISGAPQQQNDGSGGILVSDVIPSGPAFGLLQVGDRITSCNGYPLEHADYSSAVAVMKEAQQLNMIVKRRVPVPFVEFEQRTLKFTLSKSRKKDDFGIVLGCRFYIKEILNPKLAEKEPGLKEGDTVLRVNGQSLEGVTLEEASRLLQRSREKLSLVVQRDVRRAGSGGNGGGGSSRWPSQTTVYERLGSLQATPRQSPTPAHYGFPHQVPMESQYMAAQTAAGFGRKGSAASGTECSSVASGYKRFSDPMTGSVRVEYGQPSVVGPLYAHTPQQMYQMQHSSQQPAMHIQMHNNGRPMLANVADGGNNNAMSVSQQGQPQSPYLHGQRLSLAQPRAQSQTPSSVQSLPTATQPQFAAPSSTSAGQQYNGAAEQQIAMGQRMGNQQMAQQRSIRTVNFQKGPSGLGIRVIGGNQVGVFVSAVQEQSPADQNGIRVGDRIHAVNGVSITGLTREEAFEVLLSLGEQHIGLAVENCPEEFAQVKAGKFGDSFYVRTHLAYSKAQTLQRGQQQQQTGQQPAELSFQPGDIFHVTDTLFGGSPGYWQVTKVYSAVDAEQKPSAGTGQGPEPNAGIIPHAKMAEQLMAQQRQAERATNGINGNSEQSGGGGTLSRSLFRKKLSLSSRKFFGGGGNQQQPTEAQEEVFSAGSGSGNYAAELVPPAYERVALKRPAFHRPVVLFGPLADVARQLLLTQSGLRFGAPLPSTPSTNPAELMVASTSSDRGIRLSSVDAVMAAQKHCVLCVSPSSVERLQLAQYAPIVILIDVDSRSRVRELRNKAGANTQSSRKLMEQAAKLKKTHSHLLTATLDASKEDQWFEALRALIFHLQERRVWMPEFQPEQPLDDLVLFPVQQQGETPTSDGDKSDYGIYDAAPSGNTLNNNNTLSKQQQMSSAYGQMGTNPSGSGPYLVSNPAYSLANNTPHQQHFVIPGSTLTDQNGHQMPSDRPSPVQLSTANAGHKLHTNSARNSPFHGITSQTLSLYTPNAQPQQPTLQLSARSSPKDAKSQLLAQLASELSSPKAHQ